MTFQLRDYQREAIDALYNYWSTKRGDFPIIVAPTGAGKTALISQIIKDAMSFTDTRVLVLTHVKELLEQGAQEVLELYPECDFGFYSAGIGQKRLDKPVTFAGIQSIWKLAFDMVPPPDLVLIDEAHMLPKNTETRYGKFIRDLRQCNPLVKIVGLTATPYRLDSGMLHEGKGAVFDGIAYDIPIGKLIDDGHLSPVVSRAGHREIDLSNVKMRGGEFVEHDLAIAASDPELVRATVSEIVELGADRKAWLVFASGIDHAKMLAEEMSEAHCIDCAVVTGSDGKADRAKAIDDFRQGRARCLINCNVLTTGFNVRHVDLVALVRATASTGLYVQMVGRGTRKAPGKEDCLARGTLILTDKGLVKIEDVTIDYKVWDGVSFVSHGGAVCKGLQSTIEYDGLCATPDHKVMTDEGWMQISEAKRSGRRIVRTGVGRVPIRVKQDCFKEDKRQAQQVEGRSRMHVLRSCFYEQSEQYEAPTEHKSLPRLQREKTSQCPALAIQKMPSAARQVQQPQEQPLCEIWRSRDTVQVLWPQRGSALDCREYRHSKAVYGIRPDRQRRPLRAGEFALGSSCHEHEQQQQKQRKQGKIYRISPEIPASQICRRNAYEACGPNERRGDIEEMGEAFTQTKREVWDILNAGPLQRFTANGRLVHNCLILDYGGNVERHGFIDQVKPKRNGGSGDGDAPAKKCPDCDYMLPTATRLCPHCGHEFPAPSLNHGHKSYGGAVLSSQVQREWLDVDDVTYSRWQGKNGKQDTLRVTYKCGITFISEWLCPDHGGYAAAKYQQRLASLGGSAVTLADALLECDDWITPARICVMPDGKFQKIVQLDYTQPPPPAQEEIDRAAKLERDLADFM